MKIGIVTDTNTEAAVVAETLEGGGYIIVVETETMNAEAIVKNEGEGKNFFDVLKKYDCEAVVCGKIQKSAFENIANAQITRYNGYGLTIGEAAEGAHYDVLPLIVAYEGGKSCREEEHHDECECGVEED